jgi:signal peptidase I
MFGIRKRRPPPFGGVHVDDDKDIQVQKPEQASRNDLWSEARLLLRDLIFALMIAALVVVFIVQPVKVEGTSMLPRLHDGERIFGPNDERRLRHARDRPPLHTTHPNHRPPW